MVNLQKAINEAKVLKKSYSETAAKYGITYSTLYHHADLDVSRAGEHSRNNLKSLREEEKDLSNHESKCRLCIVDVEENSQIEINEDIRSMILELQLEWNLIGSYSNFICENCHQNLQQLSSFRRTVNEKQQKLSQFLCKIKHENSEPMIKLEPFSDPLGMNTVEPKIKLEPFPDSLDMNTVVVKIEPLDDENPVEKINERIECATCSKHFSSVGSLQCHIQSVHKGKRTSDKTDTANVENPSKEARQKIVKKTKNSPCTFCKKTFASQDSLSNHMNALHFNAINHLCDLCGANFHFKKMLKHHMVRHIPHEFRQKIFMCNLCSRNYQCELHLTLHMKKRHQKNYNPKAMCTICGLLCEGKKSRNKHMKEVHSEENANAQMTM